MRGGVIVKSRKAHYSQVRYHAHSTYIQLATKQLEIKNQSKGHKQLLNQEKLYKKISKIFTKINAKRVYGSPPYLNLTISSLGAEEPQQRKKKGKKNKTQICTN